MLIFFFTFPIILNSHILKLLVGCHYVMIQNGKINSHLPGSWWPGHFSWKFSPSELALPKTVDSVSHRFRPALSTAFCSFSFLLRAVYYKHSPMDNGVHALLNVNSEMIVTICQSARWVVRIVVWAEQLAVFAHMFSIKRFIPQCHLQRYNNLKHVLFELFLWLIIF